MEKNYTVVDTNVYYQGHYWNDYELVRQQVNKRVSGKENVNWYRHFIDMHPERKFRKALFVNCGNGWVEREMYKTGLFEEAVGVDYLQTLVDEAGRLAVQENLPIRYYQLDINTGVFPETGFDLVVNHAGCHHIAFLDKVLRAICGAMTEGGYFINFDYVGPHRNQYGYEQWNEAYLLNERLPEEVRQVLNYPHLPTMLVADPTEAIHSELILEYTNRYFNMEEHKRGGGALAYLLLTFNKKMQEAAGEVQDRWVRHIMDCDGEYTERYPASSMFDYFIGTPRKDILEDAVRMKVYEEEENARENNCAANQGLYYSKTLLQQLYLEIEDLRNQNWHMRSDLQRIYSNPVRSLAGKYKNKISEFLKRK
jgi:SAM-dependent methyltransferase